MGFAIVLAAVISSMVNDGSGYDKASISLLHLFMKSTNHSLIQQAYAGFNARNIDAILVLMHTDVQWPNGWEGGYVYGHEAVRAYWTRQWQEINPYVEPVVFTDRPDGTIEVDVHQVVKDRSGNLLFDGMVKHVYTIVQGLIQRMDIEKPE